jgi:hypothetical protein
MFIFTVFERTGGGGGALFKKERQEKIQECVKGQSDHY